MSEPKGPPAPHRTRITPTLSVRRWPDAIAFYKAAFGAVELLQVPGGGLGQLSIDGAEFWVAQESPAHADFSPKTLGGSSARLRLTVDDPATLYARAVAAGATQIIPLTPTRQYAHLLDPFGHHWEITRHPE